MKNSLKSRIKAGGLHLLISFLAIGIIVALFIGYFFPGPFLYIDSVDTVLTIIISVDLTLGPLLTFVIYRHGKKGLLFDLVLIAVMQVLALGYGLWSIYESRPAYLVLYGDTFYLADIKRIDQSKLAEPSLAVSTLSRPRVVIADIPGSTSKRFTLAMEYINKGVPIQFDARFFKSFEEADRNTIDPEAIDTGRLERGLEKQQRRLLHKYDTNPDHKLFYIVSHVGRRIAIVDTQNHRFVKILDIDL